MAEKFVPKLPVIIWDNPEDNRLKNSEIKDTRK